MDIFYVMPLIAKLSLGLSVLSACVCLITAIIVVLKKEKGKTNV